MLAKHQSEFSVLPKDTVSEKEVDLKYMESKKVVSQNINKNEIMVCIYRETESYRNNGKVLEEGKCDCG